MTPDKVATYLQTIDGVKNVQPVQVTIGKRTFPGARFTKTLKYAASDSAVLSGTHQVGDTYTQDVIYLLGATTKADFKIVLQLDGQDWFIAGYYDKITPNTYHPFGKCFQLRPWDVDTKIDAYEAAPRKRVPFIVTPVIVTPVTEIAGTP